MAAIQLKEDYLFDNDPLSALVDDDINLPAPPPSPAETKLIGQLRTKIDHASRAKRGRELGWEYNRLLQRGEQYIAQDVSTGEIIRLAFEESPNDLLSVDNLLLETSRAAVGKYIRIIPSVVVLPRTEDRADMRAAEVIDSFAAFQWDNLAMKLLYKRAMEYIMWAGTAPFEPCWDKHKGRKLGYCSVCHFASDVEQPGEPCPVCMVTNADPTLLALYGDPKRAQGGPPQQLTEICEGDVALRLHDPRDFFPEPGIAEVADMQYCYTKTAQPVNLVRQWHPDKAGLIKSQDGIYTDRAAVYALGNSQSTRYDSQALVGHCYYHRFHLAPTGRQKKGTIVTMVNDRIMEVVESPYYQLFGQLPFEALRGDREARVFWGIPPIDNAGALQKERNTLSTQARENRELTGNPKLLVGENSGIDVERMNTIPGEVLKVKPTPFGRPAFLIPPAFAQYVYAEFDRLARALRGKFGVTDNEAGIAPADQSGRLGAILEAQGNEAISPIVLENMHSWIKIQYFCILIGQKYYSRDRKWAIRGQDMPKSYSFGSVDAIRSGWNLMLADEDSLSKNPALRLQQALLLWDKGIYIDPATQLPNVKKFLRHANLRMPGMVPDSEGTHRAYAANIPNRIREAISDGKPPFMPRPWDDALVCADELGEWLRAEGDKAPEPITREVFNVWIIYAQAALAMGADPRALPNMALAPPPPPGGQGAPGAPAQLPTGPGTGAPAATSGQEAGQLVQQADAQAEGMARAGRKEGGVVR